MIYIVTLKGKPVQIKCASKFDARVIKADLKRAGYDKSDIAIIACNDDPKSDGSIEALTKAVLACEKEGDANH